MADTETLLALRRHNDQLTGLLSPEGLAELDRLALLETALLGFVSNRVNEYQKQHRNILMERLTARLGIEDKAAATRLATDIGSLQTDALAAVKDAIETCVNAYLKKIAAGIRETG